MASNPPPAKRRKPNYIDTFEVLVGTPPDHQRFCVYTEQLCRRSPFLEAARSARWNQNTDSKKDQATTASKKPVELVDDDPDVFASYLEVVYTGKLSVCFRSREDDDRDEDESEEETEEGSVCTPNDGLELVEIYVLADKLGDLTSANFIADRIIRLADKVKCVPGEDAVRYAYAHSAPGSVLRRMMVDYHIHEASEKHVARFSESLGEYMHDVTCEYKRITTKKEAESVNDAFSQWLVNQSRCHYHQHNSDHPACEGTDSLAESPEVQKT